MPLRPLERVGEDLAQWASSTNARVPTGYRFFDSRTSGGIATGEMAVMICHSGVGKTWYMVNVARHNAATPTVLFSLEMHGRYILQRLAGAHQNIATSRIEETLKRNRPSPAVEQTITDYPLLQIEDDPDLGFGDMADTLQEYEDITGLKPRLVIVDYLELVKSFDAGAEHVDGIARAGKKFARAHDVALIMLHQVKRREHKIRTVDEKGREKFRSVPNVGQAPLTTHDAKFGGNTQADYVIGMYKPSMDPELTPADAAFVEHDLRFQLLKTRVDGGLVTSGVQHHWNPRSGRISELTDRHGQPLVNDTVVTFPGAVA